MQKRNCNYQSSYVFLILLIGLLFQERNLFSAAGDLDPSFGVGGKVTTDHIGPDNDYGYDSAIQPDGKIVLAGTTYLRDRSSRGILIRLFADGTLDPSFADNGKLIVSNLINSTFQAVQIQPDGKVLAAGAIGFFRGIDFLLMRFNSDGSPDITFGSNGIVTLDWDEQDGFNDLAIQADGKIVAVGFTGWFSFDTGHNWWYAITRFNPNGSIDSSFGNNGKVHAFGGNDEGDSANSVNIQSDGKIVAGGNACCDNHSADDFGLVRLNVDGTIDTSFGTNGQIFTDFNKSKNRYHSSIDAINSIDIQPDGKIVAAGVSGKYYRSKIALARYQPDGTLDSSFGESGRVITKIRRVNRAYDLQLQSDGRILIGAAVGKISDVDFAILRYNDNGSLDGSFGSNGIVRTYFSDSEDELHSLLLFPDGKILGFGYAENLNQYDLAAILYDSSGNIDMNFGDEGKLSIGFVSSTVQYISGIKIDNDGKIIAAGLDDGSPNQKPLIMRYLGNGNLDSTFGESGVTSEWVGEINDVGDLTLTNEGKIILVGRAYRKYEGCIYVARYNSNGSLDKKFGTKGITCLFLPAFSQLSAVVLQSDGKIVAAGSAWDSDNQFLTVRFNPDGALDSSFGNAGIVITPILPGEGSSATDVAIQADGKIVVGGYLNDYNGGTGTGLQFALVRYDINGTLDSEFGSGGIVRTNVSSGSDAAHSIVLQDDGKIIAGGFANDDIPGSTNDFALVRYLSDGSLDPNFGSGGIVRTDFSADETVWSVAIQSDEKIIAAGSSQNNNQSQFLLARYDNDGNLDMEFGINGRVITSFSPGDSYASSIKIQSDGKIVAGGTANMGSTFSDFALARYQSE